MAAARFSVLKLPAKSLKKIFALLDLDDLFHLSLCSKKTQDAVRDYARNLNPKIRLWTEIENRIGVDYFDEDRTSQASSWCFLFPKELVCSERMHKMKVRIDNTEMMFRWKDLPEEWFCASKNPGVEFVIMLNYLKDVFQCVATNITIDVKYFEDLDELLNSPAFRSVEILSVTGGTVTEEELKGFINNFQTDLLVLDCSVTIGSKFPKFLEYPRLSVRGGVWFTRMHLLQTVDCQEVTLSGTHLFDFDFNAFISYWYHSRNTKLKSLAVMGKRNETRWYHEDDDEFEEHEDVGFDTLDMRVLGGNLPLYRGSPKDFTACSLRDPEIRFEFGIDIRRPSDGAFATFLFVPRGRFSSPPRFIFVVWQRNPFLQVRRG